MPSKYATTSNVRGDENKSRSGKFTTGFTFVACVDFFTSMVETPGAKIINVFRARIGAQLTICAQK